MSELHRHRPASVSPTSHRVISECLDRSSPAVPTRWHWRSHACASTRNLDIRRAVVPGAFRQRLNVDKDDFEELCGGPQCALFQTTTVMKELLEHELITYASDPLSFRKTPEPDERTTAKPDGRKMDAPRNPTRPGHSVRIAWLTESDTDFGLVDPMQDTSGRNLSDKSSSRLGVEFPFPFISPAFVRPLQRRTTRRNKRHQSSTLIGLSSASHSTMPKSHGTSYRSFSRV